MLRLRTGSAAAMLAVMAMLPAGAHAACGATVNGAPMPPNVCAAARQVYGSVNPGHYWMDAGGNWGYVGSPIVRGNLLRDAQGGQRGQSGGGGRPWTYRGPGGYGGSDGNCSYINTPNGSVMTGNCD